MKCVFESLLRALVPVVVLSLATQASGQIISPLQKLRFIPSHSTLEVLGVDIEFEQTLFAYGKLGLVVGYDLSSSNGSSSAVISNAQFFGVDSWLVPDNGSPHLWHTDFTLNLSGLAGASAPDNPDDLFFQGLDGQGQPITLTVVQRDALVHISAQNSPECCGFLSYRFDALAHVAPYADFNLDGIVDDIDAQALLTNMGTNTNATFEQGDADGDGDVDGNDFLAWQREIGDAIAMSEFAPESSTAAAMSAAIVPEPSALVLGATWLLAAWPVVCRRSPRD